MVAKDNLGMLPQPGSPKFKTALVGIYVRNQPYGGSDKSNNGLRYDTIPFANGMILAGMSCQCVHYVHQEHDKFFEVMKQFDRGKALVIGNNKYDDRHYQPLTHSAEDAESITAALRCGQFKDDATVKRCDLCRKDLFMEVDQFCKVGGRVSCTWFLRASGTRTTAAELAG